MQTFKNQAKIMLPFLVTLILIKVSNCLIHVIYENDGIVTGNVWHTVPHRKSWENRVHSKKNFGKF